MYNEEMVGAGHPAKADTLNRLALIEHNEDGTHKFNITGAPELDLREFLPYGFVTDGSVDYSTEIQECITAGKRIFIPAGTWLCRNLNVRGWRHIRGSGKDNTVLRMAPGVANYLINSSDGATGSWMPYSSIRDLTLDGNGSTDALGAIYAKFITQWEFERVAIYGFYNAAAVGLHLHHAYQVAMRDVYVRMGSAGQGKKGEACFKVSADSDPIHTTHITFDSCLAQWSGVGYLLDNLGNRGDEFTIRQSAAGSHDYGIRVRDNYRGVRIENTLIENCSVRGVSLTSLESGEDRIHNVVLDQLTLWECTIGVFANKTTDLRGRSLRFVGDDAGGHTMFSIDWSCKRVDFDIPDVELTAYDTVAAPGSRNPFISNLDSNSNGPSVAFGAKRHTFKTNNSNPTTIESFTGGYAGQEITVIFGDANTTIDFTGTSLKGNGGSDFTGAVGDVMTGVFDGTNWYFNVQDNTP